MPALTDAYAAAHPDAVAVRDGGRLLTWAQLSARVDAWVHVLRGHGLRQGDRVACIAGNRAETFELILAALHAGLTLVPVNWHLTVPEIAYILTDSRSRGVVTDADRAQVTAQALRLAGLPCPMRAVMGDGDHAGLTAVEPLLTAAPREAPQDQTCGSTMMYTSGTTGAPKGVVNGLFTTGAPYRRAERMVAYSRRVLGVPSAERVLLAGPWYHSAQLFFALLPLLAGSQLVIHRGFDAEAVLRDIDRLQINVAHLVPAHFVRLLRLAPDVRGKFRADSLRLVWHGGGACPIAVKQAMIDWWGPVLVEYYGATEGGAVTLISSEEWLRHPGSVGRAVPPNELLIMDANGAQLPAGHTGRVFIRRRGGESFRYHNAPEKTRAAHLGPDTFTYGEVGYVDRDGYLYLTGRAQDLIISGGVNVYPAEVEAVLQAHPQVRDAAVVGVPDPEYGERVVAVLELAGPPGPAAAIPELLPDAARSLDEHCRRSLAGFKVPRAYFTVASVPREATGKLRKDLMRDLIDGWLATAKARA